MSADYRISLSIEGLASEDGHVLAPDFLRAVQLLLAILKRIERQVTRGAEKDSIYFRVVDLSHSSPATVVLQAQTVTPSQDQRHALLERFFSVLGRVESGSLQGRFDYPMLASIRDMTRPVGRTLAALKVSGMGKVIPFDERFRANIETVLAPEQTYPGTIRGVLEAINVHDGANVFRIFPDVGPSKVACHFPASLERDAVQAIRRFVEVTGILKYKTAADYPHEVEVRGLEVLPLEEDLPSLSDLRGTAPECTGALLSEEFIRSLRDVAQ
jgi:hypothetical protein